MQYLIISLLAILATTLIVYKLANSIFGLGLRLRPLLLCAAGAMLISIILPKFVVGFAGLSGTVAVLAVFAVIFAYFVAKMEDQALQSDNSQDEFQEERLEETVHLYEEPQEEKESNQSLTYEEQAYQEDRLAILEGDRIDTNVSSEEKLESESVMALSLIQDKETTACAEPLVTVEADVDLIQPHDEQAHQDDRTAISEGDRIDNDVNSEEKLESESFIALSLIQDKEITSEPLVTVEAEDNEIQDTVQEDENSYDSKLPDNEEQELSPSNLVETSNAGFENIITDTQEDDLKIDEPINTSGSKLDPQVEIVIPPQPELPPCTSTEAEAIETIEETQHKTQIDADGEELVPIEELETSKEAQDDVNELGEDQVISPNSEDLDGLLEHAFICKEQHNFDAALSSFTRALALYPNSDAAPFLVVEVGNLLKNKGAYDEAIKVFTDGRKFCQQKQDELLEQEFISTIAYLRIIKNMLIHNRLGLIPFTEIPPQVQKAIDEEFKEWRNVGNI